MMCMAKIAIAAYCSGAPQGLPNKIFEYMAAGLAILSSLDGECKQFLEDNACGLYYPAAGADGFLAALLPQLEEPGLAERLGGNGRKAFLERYAEPIVYSRLTTQSNRYWRQAEISPAKTINCGYGRSEGTFP